MKNNLLRNLSLLSIISLLTLSPAFAFADKGGKDKKENKKQDRQEKVEKRESNDDDDDDEKENRKENKCWVAYGHLISFGWLKKNKPLEIDGNCYLPFGIAKKFRGTSTTTPTDSVAPVISSIVVNTDITKATITWATDEKSNSTIFWSTISPVNTTSSSTQTLSQNNKVKNHKMVLNGLSASTTYFAIVKSKDSSGNVATSSEFSFTTKAPVIIGDTVPPTIFSVVAVVSISTSNIGWQTNEPATSKVYYSTTSPISTTSASFVESNALSTVHLLKIQNLATSTTYYAIVESKDAALNTRLSDQFSFTTASGI